MTTQHTSAMPSARYANAVGVLTLQSPLLVVAPLVPLRGTRALHYRQSVAS